MLIGNGLEDLKLLLDQSMESYTQSGVSWANTIIPRIGISTGISAECLITDNYGFKTGFNYSQRGFIIKKEWNLDSNNPETTSLNYKFQELTNIHLNYLDYPILLTRRLNNKSNIALGGILSFMLSDNIIVNTKEEYQTYDANGNPELIIDETEINDDYKGLISDEFPNFILGGVSLEFNYKIKRLGISTRLIKYSPFGTINGINVENKNLLFNLSLNYYIKNT